MNCVVFSRVFWGFLPYDKFLIFVLKILGTMIILPVPSIIPHLSKEFVFVSLGTVCILGSMLRNGTEEGERGKLYFVSKLGRKTGFGTLTESSILSEPVFYFSREVL